MVKLSNFNGMEDPEAYDGNVGDIAKVITRELFPQIISQMTWDKAETILDFGCGPGYVTKNILKPLVDNLSPNNTIYGMDISAKMIEFASVNYASPNISYLAADILKTDLELPCVDKIVSAWVLHWIYEQKKALTQMYNLLNVKGEIGLFYVTSAPYFPIFEKLANEQKWAPFLTDFQNFISPPMQNDPNPVCSTRKMLEEIGYSVQECTLTSRKHVFDSFDDLMGLFLTLDPNISRIPPHMVAEYTKDLRAEFRHVVQNIQTPTSKNGVEIPYDLLLIRARKEA